MEIIQKMFSADWPAPVNEGPEYLAEWLAFELGDQSNMILNRQAAWFVLIETLRVLVAQTKEEIDFHKNIESPAMLFKYKLDKLVRGNWEKFIENRILGS